MKKTVAVIYNVLLAAGILLILLGFCCAKSRMVHPVEGATELAAAFNQIDPDTREFTVQMRGGENTCLAFFTAHQYVWVYQDGKLLYSLEDGGTPFGSSAGGGWHFVETSLSGGELLIRLQAVYPQMRDYEVTFYQGDAIRMYLDIMQGSVPEVIVSILDMTLGSILLVYCLIARREIQIGGGAVYFGIFAVLMGAWSLNETEMMTVLVENRVAASFVGYMLLMLMIAPFVFFVREFLTEKRDRFSYLIVIASYLDAVICTALHMTRILEFKYTVFVTHALMIAALVYLMYALVCRIRRNGIDRKARVNIVGLGILVASFFVDLGAYYMGARKTDVFGRFAFLLYVVLLGSEVARGLVTGVKEGRKAEIYRELAVKDMPTGLYNRNAYDEWVRLNPAKEKVAILTFDLNELKRCNDTLGHAAGDQYIQDAAKLLTEVFEPAGRCYRIGGDEFCVLVEDVNTEWLGERIRTLELLERRYNQQHTQIHMQIASGYAIFDEKRDQSLEDTRNRADEAMYQNKKALKQGR